MATTFKTFLNDDVASTRTLLHEGIPISGGILFGTYPEPGVALSNIKTYAHGMFQSVYDYSYTKSSANHIFDITVGVSSVTAGANLTLGTTVAAMATKKNMIYNEFAKILAGYDTDGVIRQFDEDGDLTQGDKIKECFVVSVARLLNKDEVKKGSFYMDLDVTSALPVASCSIGGRDGAAQATATLDLSGSTASTGELITLISTDGTSRTYVAVNGTPSTGLEFDNSSVPLEATTLATAIASSDGHNGKITTAPVGTSGSETGLILTQLAGASGNQDIVHDLTGPTTIPAAFLGGTNGTRAELRISDSGAATDYKINSPAGDYGILKCDTYNTYTLTNDVACTDGANPCTLDYTTGLTGDLQFLDRTAGLIFYQAGVVVLNPFIFERHSTVNALTGYNAAGTLDGRLPNGGDCTVARVAMSGTNAAPVAVDAMFEAETIDACATSIRTRVNKMAFNNTTELNSTIYFCRVGHNDFNYSSNPTYLKDSKIMVKERQSDAPVSYITSVGLYSADNELLAMAKLSEPLRKDPTNEMVLRVRLDY